MPTRIRLVEGDTTWTAEVDGRQVSLRGEPGATVESTNAPGGAFVVDLGGGARIACDAAEGRDATWVQIGADVFEFRPWRSASAHSADALTPPMSATVVRIAVKAGDAVRRGDLLLALEAMKMELPIRAPHDGVVRAVHCREGDLVQPGQVLIDV